MWDVCGTVPATSLSPVKSRDVFKYTTTVNLIIMCETHSELAQKVPLSLTFIILLSVHEIESRRCCIFTVCIKSVSFMSTVVINLYISFKWEK